MKGRKHDLVRAYLGPELWDIVVSRLSPIAGEKVKLYIPKTLRGPEKTLAACQEQCPECKGSGWITRKKPMREHKRKKYKKRRPSPNGVWGLADSGEATADATTPSQVKSEATSESHPGPEAG